MHPVVERFNLHRAELHRDDGDPPGYRSAWASVAGPIGARRLAGNLIEIDPHAAAAPYHWEAACEEWLLVLDGAPTLRMPDGPRQLRAGDMMCFSAGPDGAHQVFNHTDAPVRILMLSDTAVPNVFVYPDSDKVMLDTEHEAGLMFRRRDAVDYWEGERR